MGEKTLWSFGLVQGLAVVCGLVTAGKDILPTIRLDPVAHVRSTAALLQKDTAPGSARVVYQELTGYFPAPPRCMWEVETDLEWDAYQRAVRRALAPGFTLVQARSGDSLCSVMRVAGEVQRLEMELLSGTEPTRVRWSLTIERGLPE